MGKRTYRLIGFKAYADTDADLLAWWESIAPGQRSDALRELLRIALGYHQIAMKQEADVSKDIAWMRDALNDLPGYVERVVEYVVANAVPSHEHRPAAHDESPLNTEPARRREERMKRRRW